MTAIRRPSPFGLGTSDRRPRVFAAIPGVFPSTVINVAKPLMRLHEAGAIDLDLTFHFLVRRRQIERADVLVLSHTIDPSHAWILDYARETRTPLLYDVDENLLEPLPDEPGLDFHRAPGRQAAVRQALAQAALVRAYAPALARYLQPFNANVVRADGPVEWSLMPAEPPKRDSDPVHIVYATSRQQDGIGAVLVEPLKRVLDEHANVDVTIWGRASASSRVIPACGSASSCATTIGTSGNSRARASTSAWRRCPAIFSISARPRRSSASTRRAASRGFMRTRRCIATV
ncbi:MAG: hypothetical protein HY047_15725 [Acidobacteria bacterium]|nr:hypothetical protein [Acidobacteriota bacterium]